MKHSEGKSSRSGRARFALTPVAVLILLTISGLQTPATGQCAEYRDFVHPEGWLDEPTGDVEVAGNNAYLAGSSSLVVVDITDPGDPVVRARVALPSYSGALEVAGSYAYVADGDAGIQIVSIADPSAPVLVGGAQLPGSSGDVAVSGLHAYVTSWDAGIHVVDIANPASPQLLTTIPTSGNAVTVRVDEGYLYVGENYPGSLSIYSLENPASPVFLSSTSLPSQEVGGLSVGGGYVYVGCRLSGLVIIEIADPTSPHIVTILDTPGQSEGSVVEGSTLYLADESAGLQVIDISSPESPHIIGSMVTSSDAYRVDVAGSHAFLTGGDLYVIDVSNPNSPSYIGHTDFPGDVHGPKVAVAGRYAYMVADSLRILDISNPTAPTVVGSASVSGDDIAVRGSYAYVGCGLGIEVVDVSDPTAPVRVSTLRLGIYAIGIAINGDFLYVSGGTWPSTGRFDVVSIQSPTNPVLRGSVSLPGFCEICGAAADGSYAYVAYGGELIVIDVSNPAAPAIVSSVPCAASEVALQGSYAYVADYARGMTVVDISRPKTPQAVGVLTMPMTHVRDISVGPQYAYLATREAMLVIDVMDPTAPMIIGGIGTANAVGGVAQDGSYAYVASDAGGFYVVPIQCGDPLACCFPDGHCEFLAEGLCRSEGGIPQGYPSNCDTGCPAYGACCRGLSRCTVGTEAECTPPDDWMGEGTVCDPNPCPGHPPSGTTYYVRPDGTGESPPYFPTIQAALDYAYSGDEIVLMKGTFTGAGNRAISFLGKAVTVRSEGGNPDQCVINCQGADGGFVFESGEDNRAVLEAVTITGGWKEIGSGGGIVVRSSSPWIKGCKIVNCNIDHHSAGGGVYCGTSASPLFTDCTISGCSAGSSRYPAHAGAGIFSDESSTLTMRNCVISDNHLSGEFGGGVVCYNGVLSGCTIDSNSGGGSGGGIYIDSGVIEACDIRNNWALSAGGVYAGSNTTIRDCVIADNSSDDGGGAIVRGDNLTITGSTISGNGGAGSAIGGSNLNVSDCVITGNRGYSAGGISARGSSIIGCTISGNCGFLTDGAGGLFGTDTQVQQTILWGNTNANNPQGHEVIGSNLTLTCCDLDLLGASGSITYLGPQVYADPRFCAPASCQTPPGGNYTLRSDSPCLPQGSPCGHLIGALGVGCPPSGLEDLAAGAALGLMPGRPNPLVDETVITFGLAKGAVVDLAIYDVGGRCVRRLASRTPYETGVHHLTWKRSDDAGRLLPSGVYICRLRVGEEIQSKRLIVLR